jgi:hypothetical protein
VPIADIGTFLEVDIALSKYELHMTLLEIRETTSQVVKYKRYKNTKNLRKGLDNHVTVYQL